MKISQHKLFSERSKGFPVLCECGQVWSGNRKAILQWRDQDLQIRGAPGHPDREISWGGGRSQKNFFRPFEPQFGLKIRGAAPPGPSPGSATVLLKLHERNKFA